MADSDKGERSHILIANVIAFCMMVAYGASMWMHLAVTGDTQMRPHFIAVLALVSVFMTVSLIFDKKGEHLAFLIPGSMVVGLFLSFFMTGGTADFLLALAGICAISGAYFNLKAYLRFILFLNLVLFLFTVVLKIPIEGGDEVNAVLYVKWALAGFAMLAVYIAVRNATNIQAKSNMAMASFRTLLTSTPNAVALMDSLNRVTFISKEFIKFANVHDDKYVAGRPVLDLLANGEMADMVATALDSAENFTDTVKLNMDGEEKYFQVIFIQMEDGSNGRLIDISDVSQIMRSKDEAEKASRAKSDFLSRMSHEIRTPMNAVLGMSELILRENISALAREQAGAIKRSGEHLLAIINDILDFSKIETGNMEIINSGYFFHSMINDVIAIIKMRITNPHLHFAVYMEHDIPNELLGDEVRMRQVLINVLTNAVKYTPGGYVAMDIKSEKTEENTVMLIMAIKDTGIGIKQEDMEKLFCEFMQFDLEKNLKVEGTGLGLAITQNVVRLMGGDIAVKSEYGKGSEFVLRIPQKLPAKCRATDAQRRSFNSESVLLYGHTPIYIEYTARCLKDLSVDYRTVSDDEDLCGRLTEGKWKYVFAEGELVHTAVRAVNELQHPAKIVMMADSHGAAKGGRGYSVLAMPAYFLSVADFFDGGTLDYSNGRLPEYFSAPSAKVLIVDDINTNLKVAEWLMQPYGMDISLCTDGQGAIDAVRKQDYDIVLMDHMMPVMDGVETVRKIREMDGAKYAALPIVALTANAIVGAKKMFLKNGFNDFISKPIDSDKLNDILAKWIPKEKQIETNPSIENTYMKEKEPAVNLDISDIKIENVDVRKGMSLCGGGQKYIQTLAVFLKDGQEKIRSIASCIESGNLALYTTHVHALKSACANIGAGPLSQEAGLLEDAGIKGNPEFVMRRNADFTSAMEKLLAGINDVLTATTEKTDLKPVDSGILKNRLAELKAGLESFDIAAIDRASQALHQAAQLYETDSDLSGILHDAFVGKYREAAAKIEEILAKI